MRKVPHHPGHARDPELPKSKKKLLPTLITSGIAVLIILFTMGELPQIDAFFASLNQTVQSHNDEIVHLLIRLAPAGLLAVGAIGLSTMLLSSVRSRRKSA